MKKIILFLVMALASIGIASASDTYSRDASVLPQAAREVISNNFEASVSVVKIDRNFGRISEYEVVLSDGSEINFDASGNWKSIEVANNRQVPVAILPEGVKTYVSANHGGTKVVGIERERRGYEVTLSNGLELKFDNSGNFLRFD